MPAHSLTGYVLNVLLTVSLLGGGVVPEGWHLTPASSKWLQSWVPIGLAGQLANLASVPTQLT